MSTRQLQIRAYREWHDSTETRIRYHTFEHFWYERYARVYRLPSRITPVQRIAH
jgi:hypothetical protein